MKAISLFTGIGGFDLGFERAGIETVLQAEQDPHCLGVLARHWPQTERVTDVRDVGCAVLRDTSGEERQGSAISGRLSAQERGWQNREGRRGTDGIGFVYGGFPCQDLSVAGRRAGLGGERSGLWFEFHRVLRELRPRWAVIENVPGLLSSNQGRDFAVILDGLGELGFDVAWAVLDAQHFGVPQRRRRVFIVAGPSSRSAEQVLSLCESCGGNPETGGAPGEGVAYAASLGSNATGGFRFDLDPATYVPDVVGQAMSSKWAKGSSGPSGDEVANMVVTNGVRRLTPLECERLQGFPDGWTAGQSDSHRYRQLGNAVCVPVAEWIGHRLVAVDAMLRVAS